MKLVTLFYSDGAILCQYWERSSPPREHHTILDKGHSIGESAK